jgi:polyisoprenoid-binding protein YceI
MKKTIYAAFVFAALGLTACNSGEETATNEETQSENVEEKVEAVKYNLVASESKIDWRGAWMAPGEDGEMQEMKAHEGHVKFSDGNLTIKGEEVSGSFTIDMTTITNEDLGEEDGKAKLEGHLKSEDFFNVAKHATADVKLKSIENGDANIVINVLGMKMEETVPVTTKMKGDKMMMMGDFTVDFEKLGFKMFSPNPEKPEEGSISSKLDFSLNVVMKK